MFKSHLNSKSFKIVLQPNTEYYSHTTLYMLNQLASMFLDVVCILLTFSIPFPVTLLRTLKVKYEIRNTSSRIWPILSNK